MSTVEPRPTFGRCWCGRPIRREGQVECAEHDDPPPIEPPRRGARVVDRDGDEWQRGNRGRGGTPAIWTCYARRGRLRWSDLVAKYGPLRVIDLNDRPA